MGQCCSQQADQTVQSGWKRQYDMQNKNEQQEMVKQYSNNSYQYTQIEQKVNPNNKMNNQDKDLKYGVLFQSKDKAADYTLIQPQVNSLSRRNGFKIIKEQKGGSQGTFYEAEGIINKKRYFLKCYSQINEMEKELMTSNYVNEVRMLNEMKKTNSKCCVQIIKNFHSETEPFIGIIVLEKFQMNLANFINNYFNEIIENNELNQSESRVFTIIIMILIINAVKELHENDIIHSDIKPQNFLINIIDDSICIKICDFGFASKSVKNKKHLQDFHVHRGYTKQYQGPELRDIEQKKKIMKKYIQKNHMTFLAWVYYLLI